MKKYHGFQGGYIALLSALIFSAILMVLVFAANSEVFVARDIFTAREDHTYAKHNASACSTIALHIESQDSTRLASSTPLQVTISQNTYCTILYGNVSGNEAEVITIANSGNSFSSIHTFAVRATSSEPFIPIRSTEGE